MEEEEEEEEEEGGEREEEEKVRYVLFSHSLCLRASLGWVGRGAMVALSLVEHFY